MEQDFSKNQYQGHLFLLDNCSCANPKDNKSVYKDIIQQCWSSMLPAKYYGITLDSSLQLHVQQPGIGLSNLIILQLNVFCYICRKMTQNDVIYTEQQDMYIVILHTKKLNTILQTRCLSWYLNTNNMYYHLT